MSSEWTAPESGWYEPDPDAPGEWRKIADTARAAGFGPVPDRITVTFDSVITQHPQRATLYGCPIPDCKWTHTAPHPAVYEGGATIEESVTNTLRTYYADIESAARAHLETHSLVEWVREVMRLRDQLASAQGDTPALVTVNAGDLETILAIFSPSTHGEEESARRLRAALAT